MINDFRSDDADISPIVINHKEDTMQIRYDRITDYIRFLRYPWKNV